MLILNESKVKYDRLNELLSDQLMDLRFAEQVNIIVDLKEVVKKFFRPDMFPADKRPIYIVEEIASDIINIVGHYRNYFYKKNKYTTFYFLYSYGKCQEMISEFPEYKAEYYRKYFDDPDNQDKTTIISNAIHVVESVLTTIPHCVFVDTTSHDELVYAKALTHLIPKNQLTILLSNDDIMYQLLSKNVFLINLKGIKSDLVTMDNAVQILTKKKEPTFSSKLIPLLIAISGNKKYSFKGLTHVALIKGTKIIENLLERGIVMDVDSIALPLEFTKLDPKAEKIDSLIFGNKDQILKAYHLVRNDDNYFSNKMNIEKEISNKMSYCRTYNYFLDLNAKVFTTFPLQLAMLLQGESI